MAILDISEDKTQIYVSNPDSNNNIQDGWNPISVFYTGGQYLTDCYFVSNKGSVIEYSGLNNENTGTADTTCTGTNSGKYYTSLKKTDGLNRIDFMNSNPDIFHRYIREGAEYYEYVGYSRSKLKLSYWNLEKLFKEVYEKNGGSLPWAYGKTLGFDNIYSSNSSSSNAAGGGSGIFTWPVPEYVEAGLGMWNQITSTFGNRTHPITGQPGTMHNGIDIAAGVNGSAKIVAAASGTVVKASDSGDGYGNCVIIQHSDGYYTLYGHMATGSLTVKVGDTVNKGQQIGTMGSTGNSTGNHLHFEVEKFDGEFSMSKYYTNERLDPVEFFNDDCSPVGGSGEVVIGDTPNISDSEKQKLIASIDRDVAERGGNTDWGSQNGAWTLAYYKNNDLELTARIINHELSLTDSHKNEEGARELVKCKALIMKKRLSSDGSIYNAIIGYNQFYSKTTSAGDRFNATPPQWVRETVAAMWNGTEKPPSYWDNDAIYWIGAWDAHVWGNVGQIVGMKYNNGNTWVVLAKNDSTGRTICSPVGSRGYAFTSTRRVPGYTDVYY